MSSLPLVASWFGLEVLSTRVSRITQPYVHPLLASSAFVIEGRSRTVLIDAGLGISRLRDAHPALSESVDVVVVLTHAHFDHIGGAWEFDERLVHPSEAHLLAEPEPATLLGRELDGDLWESLLRVGIPYAERLINALPDPDFDVEGFQLQPAPATGTLVEGDVLDVGDAQLQVIHLPGHTPGSIGLLDEHRGEFFTGDAIYDAEPLLDNLPESHAPTYRDTMRRLLELDVRIVHGGHGPSFSGARMREIARRYLATAHL